MKIRITILSILGSLLFIACGNKNNGETSLSPDSIMVPKYANGFKIEYYKKHSVVVINSPWDNVNEPIQRITVEHVDRKNNQYRIATTSSSHVGFLEALGEVNCIVAASTPELIYSEAFRTKNEAGEVMNIGDSFNLSTEKVLDSKLDLLISTSYSMKDENIERMKRAGVSMLFVNEWMETTPLARAEWIKCIATFFGKNQLADSIFSSLETRYNSLKDSIKPNGKSILFGTNFKGTWYQPKGESYMAILAKDAGGDYIYSDTEGSGSLPLNFEQVLSKQINCDVWLGVRETTYEELAKADNRHMLFKPFKVRTIYNNSASILPSSANDFWESGVLNPDILLREVHNAITGKLDRKGKYLSPLTVK